MTTMSSLAALEAVVTTSSSAAGDDMVVIFDYISVLMTWLHGRLEESLAPSDWTPWGRGKERLDSTKLVTAN
jgi:hypothetical protein